MAKESFDDLKSNLTTLLANEHESLKNLVRKLRENKNRIDSVSFDYIISVIEALEKQKHSIGDEIDKLYSKAVMDFTGLCTRMCFDDFIRRLSFKYPLAYLMGDIDHFKKYNDKYGHLQGDIALKYIAKQFKETIEALVQGREKPLIARYGGEEFCAFIESFEGDFTDLEKRAEIVNSTIANLTIPKYRQDAVLPDSDYRLKTMTIAGALAEPSEHPLSLVERVDAALVAAKKKNKRGEVIILHKI